MSPSLFPCSGCRRHVRADELACPFCGIQRLCEPRSVPPLVAVSGRVASLALSAALLVAGCKTGDTTMEQPSGNGGQQPGGAAGSTAGGSGGAAGSDAQTAGASGGAVAGASGAAGGSAGGAAGGTGGAAGSSAGGTAGSAGARPAASHGVSPPQPTAPATTTGPAHRPAPKYGMPPYIRENAPKYGMPGIEF